MKRLTLCAALLVSFAIIGGPDGGGVVPQGLDLRLGFLLGPGFHLVGDFASVLVDGFEGRCGGKDREQPRR